MGSYAEPGAPRQAPSSAGWSLSPLPPTPSAPASQASCLSNSVCHMSLAELLLFPLPGKFSLRYPQGLSLFKVASSLTTPDKTEPPSPVSPYPVLSSLVLSTTQPVHVCECHEGRSLPLHPWLIKCFMYVCGINAHSLCCGTSSTSCSCGLSFPICSMAQMNGILCSPRALAVLSESEISSILRSRTPGPGPP